MQAVDPSTGLEVPDGEWGNLTVTTLDRDNGLLRYDLEEACAILRSPCPCGETSARGLWGGRFKDLLSCQGTRFQLAEVEGVLRDVAAIREPSLEYQIVRPDGGDEDLVVKVEVASADPAVREGARAAAVAGLRASLGVRAEVEILDRDTIPAPATRRHGSRSRLALVPHAPSVSRLGAPFRALSGASHDRLLLDTAARQCLALAGRALLQIAAVMVHAAPRDAAVTASGSSVPDLVARLVAPSDGGQQDTSADLQGLLGAARALHHLLVAVPQIAIHHTPSLMSLGERSSRRSRCRGLLFRTGTSGALRSCRACLVTLRCSLRRFSRSVARWLGGSVPASCHSALFPCRHGYRCLAQAIDELVVEGASLYGDAESVTA